MIKNALSFDVEDYFHVQAFADVIHRNAWDTFDRRVAANTERILRLLERHRVQATFFILGWVAEREPELVRAIAAAGHEIASHSYWHRLVYTLSPEEFADDLRRADAAIRSAVEVPIRGYRAPSFSITDATPWAFEVLRDAGFAYDSSVFPTSLHDTYGIAAAPRFANRVEAGLSELPLTTYRLGGRNLPIAGGGYFRLYPLGLTRRGIRHVNLAQQPAIVYLHPWEFDPGQPRVAGLPLKSRLRHYVNLDKTETRLDRLLGEFEFGPMCEVFADWM